MAPAKYILSLDQGTTSSRAILFTHDGRVASLAQKEIRQIMPSPGHVEHDPEEIWQSQLDVARQAMQQVGAAHGDIAAIGVANQRETTVLWDKQTGAALGNAIVWQSRITEPICERLRASGAGDMIREKTGLLIDPYFAGTKIRHVLDLHPAARERAERGEVLFGTIDSYLLWRLTGGVHATDYSNASRTLIYNIHTLDWDDELLRLLDIPRAMLPRAAPNCSEFGVARDEWFGGSIPIAGMAGDQQAATFGQACFEPGSAKNTYGTGCFMLMNIGKEPTPSKHQLLTTIGWGLQGEVTYCLEGSVFVAGAVVQWLRDGLGLIEASADVQQLAGRVADAGDVVFVPALVGLGAPHWDPYARGAIFGITRDTTAAHLARAAVESIAFQSRDLAEAMRQDSGVDLKILKVDGGAAVNNELMQFQADILDAVVQRPVVSETTALGVAYMAGLTVGFWESTSEVQANWVLDREFTPSMDDQERTLRCSRWQKGVERALGWAK